MRFIFLVAKDCFASTVKTENANHQKQLTAKNPNGKGETL